MKSYVSAVDKLSFVVKLVLAFFLDPIVFGIYRIAKGKLIIGLIWIFTAGLFGIGWLIDFFQLLLQKKVSFLV